MPRKKAEDGGGEGESSHAQKQQSAKEYAEAVNKQAENAIVGKKKDFEEQVKEARGETEDQKKEIREYTDGADKEAEKLLEEAFPERKAVNIRVEAKQKFNEKFGIDPNAPDSRKKVQMSDSGEETYTGRLTLKSVHAETFEDISFVVDIENRNVGKGYLFYVMRVAHPHALQDKFEVDAENETDPLLRTRYE